MSFWQQCAAVLAAASLAVATARADETAKVVVADSEQLVLTPGGILVTDEATAQGEYWIGVFASRPAPALQAQLKLPKDQGLLVEALQPESPAAKAGVAQYDILLKGNDKPLTDVASLLRLIEQVKDGKLTLDLLRAGKHETVTVTPIKRPAGEAGMLGRPYTPGEGAAARDFFGGFGGFEGRPMEFRIFHPGQILSPGGPMTNAAGGEATSVEVMVVTKSTLADGSKVEITRRGADPAQVVVTHGKQKWEGTSADLSKIPENIRPEVEKLLHTTFEHMRVVPSTGLPAGGNVTFFGGGMGAGLPGPMAVLPNVEKRLGEMQKQIDELRQTVDALKSKPKKKAAPKPE